MTELCLVPDMGLQSAIMLLFQSGVKGRAELDLSLEQIRQTVYFFGGTLELIREGDDEGQQWLTYRSKGKTMDIVCHHQINNHIYTLQLSAFGSTLVVCKEGDLFTIADNKYLLP